MTACALSHILTERIPFAAAMKLSLPCCIVSEYVQPSIVDIVHKASHSLLSLQTTYHITTQQHKSNGFADNLSHLIGPPT